MDNEQQREETTVASSENRPHIFGSDPDGIRSHERVLFGHDRETGLRAIIAIHDTTLGPALGGTRFYPYVDEERALEDVLRLSRGMTYKAATSGLDLGGGKAVIIGDPAVVKSDQLLEAYGRLVESLGGSYITAGDVGTTSQDMDVIGRSTAHVVARTEAVGGSGDSAPMTALGVFSSLRAAAQNVWGSETLDGRSVGVEGLGKVGYHLVSLLVAAGARVVATDVSAQARQRVEVDFPDVDLVDDVLRVPVDVYAPCAMGATLTPSTAESLQAQIVCGAANNQLSTADVELLLTRRGIRWVPDYVANAGGLIQVAGERQRLTRADVRQQVESIFDTVEGILRLSGEQAITPGAAADQVAEARLRAAAEECHLAGVGV
ncbi:valine dehydrogenase [Aeromicrobium sp. PE09-221]|nr:valine dehydrogenase [Aeromicrobium sp. PE09-221]